ncbi:MAG: hypothetical protein K0Q89_471 [Thermomicrobiales bacterium]|nr:hypothetical protein [Thermomicrobiales bacterium]
MTNYLARIAAAGARTTPTIRPTATPYPPLFRPLPVPRPYTAASSGAEESVVPPKAARSSAQVPPMRENDLPPSASERPSAGDPPAIKPEPMPVSWPETVRVRAPRIAPERQPEAPARAIAPPVKAVAPVAERVPVANLPEPGPVPAEPAVLPNIAPPPGAPLVTLGRPAPPGDRQRGNEGSRIAIGTIDVRVVNTPVAAAANTPSPPPASGPDTPTLARFRLRP